mgnify:CR=1 FL=1
MKKFTQPYHSLILWKEVHKFILDVYLTTEQFPTHERYGIVSQLRRAAVSIELNIVEGHAKKTKADHLRFLDIANGSLRECASLIELCLDLGYLEQEKYTDLESQRRKAGFLLTRFKTGTKERTDY